MRSDGVQCGGWLRWGLLGIFSQLAILEYKSKSDLLYLLSSTSILTLARLDFSV